MGKSRKLTFTKQHLWWHPNVNIIDGNIALAYSNIINRWKVIPSLRQFVGRTFYGAGLNLPLADDQFYPFGMDPAYVGMSEEWFMNCGRVYTGNRNPQDNGELFWREGQAHAITPDGHLVFFQDLIDTDPGFFLGSQTMAYSLKVFGQHTIPIYDKYFDSDRVLPDHRHNIKTEMYFFNPRMNKRPRTPGYHTTALGYYPGTTPEMVLAAMKKFGQGNSAAIRMIKPHVLMPLGTGFITPYGVDHAPTNLCTQEPQLRYDEHVLIEDKCGDRNITEEVAWGACRDEDIPKDQQTWEKLIEMTDWELVTDPHFVRKHRCIPVRDEKRSADGDGTITTVIYGRARGEQVASTKEVLIPAGGKHVLHFPSWSICHMVQGQCTIGGLEAKFVPKAKLNEVTYDRWFIPHANAIAPEGIEVENTGDEDCVFMCTFGPDAFEKGDLPEIE